MGTEYMKRVHSEVKKRPGKPQTAKVFFTGRSQAVRLPVEYRFDTDEVYIRKEGEEVILSPKPMSWVDFFDNERRPTPDFMKERVDLPLQERDWSQLEPRDGMNSRHAKRGKDKG
jgi:antitoxin VapB